MRIEDWLTAAIADAERRGLPELKPLLQAIARSTRNLRRADEVLRDEQPGTGTQPDDRRA